LPNALDLSWLTVRGEAVAAHYNIVWNDKLYFYQSARKVDLPKPLRPGIVILAHMIRRSIEAGLRENDFLGGRHPYKMQLTSSTRSMLHLRVSRDGVLELCRKAADWVVRQARSSLERRSPN
jgi:CelD/BcsL family acetyltransferase involved in cellulose biosynthesis